MQICTPSVDRLPAICNGHLPYPLNGVGEGGGEGEELKSGGRGRRRKRRGEDPNVSYFGASEFLSFAIVS